MGTDDSLGPPCSHSTRAAWLSLICEDADSLLGQLLFGLPLLLIFVTFPATQSSPQSTLSWGVETARESGKDKRH